MGRTIMYRDDFDKNELLDNAYKMKDIACEMIEALEGEDEMKERNRYRDGMSYRRGTRMRDEWRERDSRYGY